MTLCLGESNGAQSSRNRFEAGESCQSKAAAEKFERNIQKRLAALQSKFLELLFDGSSDYQFRR